MRKRLFLTISVICLVIGQLMATSSYKRLHENERDTPYPQAEHKLFLNPSPLLVPVAAKKSDYLQFALSQDKGFPENNTMISKPSPWCMFNPHQVLAAGNWYWRYRSVSKSGEKEEWSETFCFTVTEDIPQFATPSFDVLLRNIPAGYPRLFCFLDDGLDRARIHVANHPEYSQLLDRADRGLNANYNFVNAPYTKGGEMGLLCNFMHQAYLLTEDEVYADKMIEFVRLLLEDTPDKQLLKNDFYSGNLILLFSHTYDVCYDRLCPAERLQIEEVLMEIAKGHHSVQDTGREENHIFDNHFWQCGFREMLQLGLLLYDKNPKAKEMLEYCYELWTARAPASGFNRDGIWHNGTGYFDANIKTLYYVPSLFTHLTKVDFLQHPWYQNVGKALVYAWPPKTMSAGFGDGNERSPEPPRIRTAFADFIARETKDKYAGWYVGECPNFQGDFEMRLYRMVRDSRKYARKLPKEASKALWFPDCGEMMAHSDLKNPENNLFLSFRSSPYGSGSHTLADQNSFNLHYRGAPVYRSTGYYLNFSDPHNLLSYRHTRAHNTLLVDGIGQPFTTRGYGEIVRMLGGENISYCLGDASNAYCGISEYPMWKANFAHHKLEQSVENGFGNTALKKYRRHIFLLHPDKVVIYDELEAHKPVRWDWLLHSMVPFSIDNESKQMVTQDKENGFRSVARLFSDQPCEITQTDQFVAPPNRKLAKRGEPLENQWHLTATFGKSAANRILTVIQVGPHGMTEAPVVRSGNEFTCEDWLIEAELNPEKEPALVIRNQKTNASFSYGNAPFVVNGHPVEHAEKGSSVLYDMIEGKWQMREISDRASIFTGADPNKM